MASRSPLPLFLMVVQLLLIVINLGPPAAEKRSGTNVSSPPPGRWEVLVQNAGIASMHTVVTHMDTVVLLDRRDGGPSQIALPGDRSVDGDRTAHSVVLSFNWSTGGVTSVRPLTILTDTWCSSGQVRGDGTVVQTGGNDDDKSGHTVIFCVFVQHWIIPEFILCQFFPAWNMRKKCDMISSCLKSLTSDESRSST